MNRLFFLLHRMKIMLLLDLCLHVVMPNIDGCLSSQTMLVLGKPTGLLSLLCMVHVEVAQLFVLPSDFLLIIGHSLLQYLDLQIFFCTLSLGLVQPLQQAANLVRNLDTRCLQNSMSIPGDGSDLGLHHVNFT